jgi:hypothetical protein
MFHTSGDRDSYVSLASRSISWLHVLFFVMCSLQASAHIYICYLGVWFELIADLGLYEVHVTLYRLYDTVTYITVNI